MFCGIFVLLVLSCMGEFSLLELSLCVYVCMRACVLCACVCARGPFYASGRLGYPVLDHRNPERATCTARVYSRDGRRGRIRVPSTRRAYRHLYSGPQTTDPARPLFSIRYLHNGVRISVRPSIRQSVGSPSVGFCHRHLDPFRLSVICAHASNGWCKS